MTEPRLRCVYVNARSPWSNEGAPESRILIHGEPPEFKALPKARAWFTDQAGQIAYALHNLPGGTWDALYALMTQEKASLLAVAHDWPEAGERRSLFQMVQEIHAALLKPQVVHSKLQEQKDETAPADQTLTIPQVARIGRNAIEQCERLAERLTHLEGWVTGHDARHNQVPREETQS